MRKTSHSFNVVYTKGDISCVEQITLNVVNNMLMMVIYTNVDVVQAGAAEAIGILNTIEFNYICKASWFQFRTDFSTTLIT